MPDIHRYIRPMHQTPIRHYFTTFEGQWKLYEYKYLAVPADLVKLQTNPGKYLKGNSFR